LLRRCPRSSTAAPRFGNDALRLRADCTPQVLADAAAQALAEGLPVPSVDPVAVRGLKFAEILPLDLAEATLAARLADPESAEATLTQPRHWITA
jgi:ATP-dependent helicase Lhr and Lhr-like helicase